MAVIKIGTTPISKVFLGNTKIVKIYIDNKLVFTQSQP